MAFDRNNIRLVIGDRVCYLNESTDMVGTIVRLLCDEPSSASDSSTEIRVLWDGDAQWEQLACRSVAFMSRPDPPVVRDRNGVVLQVNDHVTVFQDEGEYSAVVHQVMLGLTASGAGHWVDVDRGHGPEGIPSYCLEVVQRRLEATEVDTDEELDSQLRVGFVPSVEARWTSLSAEQVRSIAERMAAEPTPPIERLIIPPGTLLYINGLPVANPTGEHAPDPEIFAYDSVGHPIRLGDDVDHVAEGRGVVAGSSSSAAGRTRIVVRVHRDNSTLVTFPDNLVVVREAAPEPESNVLRSSNDIPLQVGQTVEYPADGRYRGEIVRVRVSTVDVQRPNGHVDIVRARSVRVVDITAPRLPPALDCNGVEIRVGQYVRCDTYRVGDSGMVGAITMTATHGNLGRYIAVHFSDGSSCNVASNALRVLSNVEESEMRVAWISGKRQLPTSVDALDKKVLVRSMGTGNQYIIGLLRWDLVTPSHDWVRGLKGFNVESSHQLATVADVGNERSIEI